MLIRKTFIVSLLLTLLVTVLSVNAQEKKERKRNRKDAQPNSMIDKKVATEIFIDASKARILGDDDKAAELFSKCISMDPTNDAALFELAQIYFNRNDFASAADLVEKAVGLDPVNQYYRLLSMDIYGKSGRKDDLLKTCLQLVKQYPDNVDYMFELATAYLMLGKGDEAVKTYNSIEEIIGVSEEISMQKQRIYLTQHKTGKAAEEIEKLLEAYPEESSRYNSMLAEIYMQSEKPDIAAGYYLKIVETDPEDPYVHISLADYYRKKGDLVKSFDELKTGFANQTLDVSTKIRILSAYYTPEEIYNDKKSEVLELSGIIVNTHPTDPKALALHGELLLKDQKFEKAREQFKRALAADSSSYSLYESLMQADASLYNWGELRAESESAIELFPVQPIPYFFNGLALLQLKKPAEAVKILSAGEKLVSGNDLLLVQFYTYLGDAYNQTKQYSQSDESYDKALRIDPANSYVLNNYAYYLTLRGKNLEKALEMAKKGVEKDSANPANLDTYGWVFYKMGNFEQAKLWVNKAITASDKDDPDLLEHYGDILFKLGDRETALEFWKKANSVGKGSEFLEKKVKEKKLFE